MTLILVAFVIVAAAAVTFYLDSKRENETETPAAKPKTSKPKTSKPKTSKPKVGGDSTQNTPNIDVQESV